MDLGCGYTYEFWDKWHEVSESGTDVTRIGGGGVSHAVAKGAQLCVHLSSLSDLFNQVPEINVSTNTRRVIPVITSHPNSMCIPSDEKVIMPGPSILNDETDVRVAFHVIQEASEAFSPIQIISDKTGILLIFAHHLHLRSSGLP